MPVLDGAQGVGAIPTDVHALGCAAYAGPGQKWLCGPDGTGMLYTTPQLRERLAVTRRGYANLADPSAGLDAGLHEDARRLDTLSQNAETVACALAAFGVLESSAGRRCTSRPALAARFAQQLAARAGSGCGTRTKRPPSPSPAPTRSPSASDSQRARVALRDIPGQPWLRASVGAWNERGISDGCWMGCPLRAFLGLMVS